jgi:hypothetical protein
VDRSISERVHEVDEAPVDAGGYPEPTGRATRGVTRLLFIYGLIFEATGGNREEEGPGFLTALLAVGFFGTVIGVIGLGAAMIRANVLNRWAAWLFTIGLPLGLTIDMATGAFFEENGDTPEVGFFVGSPLFCIGLIWLGYEMWKGRGTGTEPAAPPVAAP